MEYFSAIGCRSKEVLEVACQPGEYIDVLDGFYGRKSSTECDEGDVAEVDVDCEVSKSNEFVSLFSLFAMSIVLGVTSLTETSRHPFPNPGRAKWKK